MKLSPQVIALISIGIAALAFFSFIIFCLVYFPPKSISTQTQDLGLYGDFIGGVVGTVISLGSLGVTIYLAVTLHRIEKENVDSAIRAQKGIALMQLKYQELISFKSNCDLALNTLDEIRIRPLDSIRARTLLSNSIDRVTTLFSELADPGNKIFIAMESLKSSLREFAIFGYKNLTGEGVIDLSDLTTEMYEERVKLIDKVKLDYYWVVKELSDWTFK